MGGRTELEGIIPLSSLLSIFGPVFYDEAGQKTRDGGGEEEICGFCTAIEDRVERGLWTRANRGTFNPISPWRDCRAKRGVKTCDMPDIGGVGTNETMRDKSLMKDVKIYLCRASRATT